MLLDPCGGAGGQRDTAAHDWKTLVPHWFAEQGFAVLVTDGRGTSGRGPDSEREPQHAVGVRGVGEGMVMDLGHAVRRGRVGAVRGPHAPAIGPGAQQGGAARGYA